MEMNFGDAIELALGGKKVRRQSWPEDHFVCFEADLLHIYRTTPGLDGTRHKMLVSTGDAAGVDWVEHRG